MPLTYTPADLAEAIEDYKLAWRDATGHDYFSSDDADKDGFTDSIQYQWAVQSAAAAIYRKRMAAQTAPSTKPLTVGQSRAILNEIAAAADKAIAPFVS